MAPVRADQMIGGPDLALRNWLGVQPMFFHINRRSAVASE